MSLHDQLQQLADTAPRPTIDHAVWDRGRALRRRDRLVTSAVVLAIVVILGGLVAVVTGPPRAFAPAGDTVPEGAIPSRILEPPADLPVDTYQAIGQGSVAFVTGWGYPVVIGASDGRYHRLGLRGLDPDSLFPPALSPDGTQLAWADPEAPALRLVDLETGALEVFDTAGISPAGVRWSPDGATLLFVGNELTLGRQERAGRVELGTGEATRVRATLVNTTGYPSPDGSVSVTLSDQQDSARFVTRDGRTLQRPLPANVSPDNASIQPLGWADDHLVVASGSASGNGAQGDRLFLFTSPDVPRNRWTVRILVRDVSPRPISVAVDLIPDLDGTSSQQLTHDFGEPDSPGHRDISWLIGLGVASALSVLYGLRWVWRRRTPLI